MLVWHWIHYAGKNKQTVFALNAFLSLINNDVAAALLILMFLYHLMLLDYIKTRFLTTYRM